MSTYNSQTPQPADIPAASQQEFLSNFQLLNSLYGVNHVPFGNAILHATRQDPTVITSPKHLLINGQHIIPSHMKGIKSKKNFVPWGPGDGTDPVNGVTWSVTVIDEDHFSLHDGSGPLDATGFLEYADQFPGDYLVTSAGYAYGSHRLLNFSGVQSDDPGLNPNNSSLYTKAVKKFAELYFQNFDTPSAVVQLTNLTQKPRYVDTKTGTGIITPWDFIFNFGLLEFPGGGSPKVYDFPIPYVTNVYSIIATPYGKIAPINFWVDKVDNTRFEAVMNLSNSSLVPLPAKFYYFAVGQ